MLPINRAGMVSIQQIARPNYVQEEELTHLQVILKRNESPMEIPKILKKSILQIHLSRPPSVCRTRESDKLHVPHKQATSYSDSTEFGAELIEGECTRQPIATRTECYGKMKIGQAYLS